MKKKMFVLISIVVLMLVSSGVSVNAIRAGDKQILDKATDTSVNQNTGKDVIIICISVYEAWDLLTNTSNGIQIPIDLRTDEEWNEGFIDTPYPECPVHYPLTLLQTPDGFQEFLEKYGDKEIVLYCGGGGGRVKQALIILSNTSFSGIIYYIGLGGIAAWIAAGLPIRTNAPPNAPVIGGPTSIHVNRKYNFTFNATDPNNDGVKYFIDWGDGFSQWTEYNYSSKDIIVSHTWAKKGTVVIKAKTMDFYGNESDWSTLEVIVPKNKAFNYNFNLIEWLFERFPNKFPLLKHFLEL
jgi:rhodanese-related sulfurtransferase